jgi:hypothetical protein
VSIKWRVGGQYLPCPTRRRHMAAAAAEGGGGEWIFSVDKVDWNKTMPSSASRAARAGRCVLEWTAGRETAPEPLFEFHPPIRIVFLGLFGLFDSLAHISRPSRPSHTSHDTRLPAALASRAAASGNDEALREERLHLRPAGNGALPDRAPAPRFLIKLEC